MRGMQHCWTHPNWVRWRTQCHMSLPHSLLATPMKHNEHPPQPSTIGYEDPPPPSRNGNDHPRMSTGTQHHHRRTATMAHWPRGPTTTIDKRPRMATRDHPHRWRMATTTNVHRCPTPPSTNSDDGPLATRTHHHHQQAPTNGNEGPPPLLTNGHEGRPEQRETRKVCGRTSLHFDPPWLTLPSMLRSMAITLESPPAMRIAHSNHPQTTTAHHNKKWAWLHTKNEEHPSLAPMNKVFVHPLPVPSKTHAHGRTYTSLPSHVHWPLIHYM